MRWNLSMILVLKKARLWFFYVIHKILDSLSRFCLYKREEL